MTVDLNLTGMAYGGEALGRDEQGRMLFVPFALDGETVRVQVTDDHARWARTRLVEVLKPSERRISPRCRHFQACGGCHYQHLRYEEQLKLKMGIVEEQLVRLGGFASPPVLPSLHSPEPWHYRSSMRFHLTPQGRLGFKGQDGSSVIPIEECHLPLPALDALWPRIQFEDTQSIEAVSLRVDSQGETMVLFHARHAPSNMVEVDDQTSVHWETPEGRLVLAGDSSLEMQVLGKNFRVSAGSFFQVNASLLPDLVRCVMAAAEVQTGQHVFDLYAGVGLFSLFLAEGGASVTAVEQSETACSDFVYNLDAYDGIELYEADVGAALSALTSAPDVVLADPPRAGLESKVITRLLDLRPARLVYISCDPATLARDARKLVAGGMLLQSVQPIDMFPQTYHIETVSLFLPA